MVSKIDFGSVEIKERSKSLSLEEGRWHAEAKKFTFVTANSGNVGIEVVYKVVDEDAVDIAGEPFTGRVWDTVWFDAKSAKITKIKLQGLVGADTVNALIIEDEDDIKDFVETLKDDYVDTEVVLVTELEEDKNDKVYDDGPFAGELKKYARVRFVNEVS